jgi:uncharacterized protein
MRICGSTLRWLLPVLLFLTAAPPMLAASSCTAVLIEQARSGDGLAQLNLGLAYANALGGLPTDGTQAVYWFRKAAEQGYAEAQYNLGEAYARGLGELSMDYTQALYWYRKAAEQGYPDAQYAVATLYAQGQGVLQNDAEAALWLRKAAEQGVANAQASLGLRYFHGVGVPKDETEAYFWLNLGTSALDDTARSVRDRAGAKLTASKRLQIAERCRKWQDAHSRNYAGVEHEVVLVASSK